MLPMSIIRTHYDNLKVARNAPEALIKAAYKVLLQQHHPDKVEVAKQAEALRITHLIKRLLRRIKRSSPTC